MSMEVLCMLRSSWIINSLFAENFKAQINTKTHWFP